MKSYFAIIVFLVISSCAPPQDENSKEDETGITKIEIPYSIDVATALNNKADYKLSDFGDNIS